MAIYQLKDGSILNVNHAPGEKYASIATAMRDFSELSQVPVSQFMELFAQAYRQLSSYSIRYDTTENFVLDLFTDGYIMVLDGSRG